MAEWHHLQRLRGQRLASAQSEGTTTDRQCGGSSSKHEESLLVLRRHLQITAFCSIANSDSQWSRAPEEPLHFL